jgi:superfamily II DNA or RNA helicase
MEITEKWLHEIGGWQAMKAARMLVVAGKVQVTERTTECIRGSVGGEKSKLNSGLLIRSRSDVENLCTCVVARKTGQICEHALAVGLASLLPQGREQTKEGNSEGSAPSRETAVKVTDMATASGQLSLYLPESLLQFGDSQAKGSTAFLKLEEGEGEMSKLAGWLKSHGAPLQNTPLALSLSVLDSLLAAAAEHPRIFIGKPGIGMHRPLQVSEALLRPLLWVQFDRRGIESTSIVSLKLAESPVPRLLAAGPDSTWLYHEGTGTIHPWKVDLREEVGQIAKELLIDFRLGKEVLRPINWLPSHLGSLEEYFQVELDSHLANRYKVVPCSPRFSIGVSGSLQSVLLNVTAVFHETEWKITSQSDPFPIQDQQIETLFYVRDVDSERVLFELLVEFGFQVDGVTGLFALKGKREVIHFYGSGLPKLSNRYSVTQTNDWLKATSLLQRISPTVERHNQSGGPPIDWLAMEFRYEAPNGFRISRSDALRLIRSGQNSVKGKDGRHYVLDSERCEEFEEALQDVSVELTPNTMRVGLAHRDYFLPFASRLELAYTTDEIINLDEWKVKLGSLSETLRLYQLEGVAWVVQRLNAGQGVLLADDMGLGKTLQSIAAIRCFFEQSPSTPQPALVVCPKSLIGNWQAEFQRFAPDLRLLVVQGPNRKEQLEKFYACDVIITSYPLISRDLTLYSRLKFSIGVLDEASFLRNPDTDTAKAVRGLQLGARLALSGTPIENGVRDLWSIFEILLPGYLGNRKTFQERFEKPLESRTDESGRANASIRLRRLIRPFFLRRTKRDVLKELPEKIEQVFWCELSPAQAELYRAVLEEGREAIRDARRRSGQNGARMTMLTVLLRLRQVCCDMRLVGLPAGDLTGVDFYARSGKWNAFDGLLDGVIAGGGKALIFSQFVSYLKLCQEHLNNRGIGYAYLDGGTPDRPAQVKSFQEDPRKAAFLISLKAGGYGLNLTQADHVFLMDPWWNPAVEAQAIDRAHRFGQNRVVNAYRFVMRGTVEERVLALQEKKRGLISASVEERAPMMEGLDDNDLVSLLES